MEGYEADPAAGLVKPFRAHPGGSRPISAAGNTWYDALFAFSFTTLDNLSRSVADPDLSVNARLRLRSNANALSRAAERNRQTLERVCRPDPRPDRPPAQPPTAPSALQKVRDAIVEAAPSLAETLTGVSQAISRQQRRFLMRKAEQARASQERESRRSARLSQRAAAPALHPGHAVPAEPTPSGG